MPNMKLVALVTLYYFCVYKILRVVQFLEKITAEGHGTEQRLAFSFRPFVGSADRPQHCCATWATNTGESFSSRARLPGAYPRAGYPSNWSPSCCRPASKPREPQARPLAVAPAIDPSLRRSLHLSPALPRT